MDLDNIAEQIAHTLLFRQRDLIDESDIMRYLEHVFPTNEQGPSPEYQELESLVGFHLKRLGYRETRTGGCFTRLKPGDPGLENYHPNFHPI